jgi:hypothetical protein
MTAEFTAKQVRTMFFEREEQACFYCRRSLAWSLRGSMLSGGWSLHHRKGRGMGGTREHMTFPHGLVLCGTGTTGCHGWVTENPEEAFKYGLCVPKNATTPEFAPVNVRVRDKAGRWFLLTQDGRRVEVEGGNS